MVINLRVKTLDSQDHEFTVDDDITVRQFKERIHEKTGVEVDLQRLIYCGRVMNDDNPLSDYNVNGKVIHLVQRPPPGSTPRAVSGNNTESSSNERRRNNEGGRNNMPFIHVLDGTVLGAMAIPMNTNTGTTQSITHSMNPSSTLCMNRITVARHMLNCANNIANYLENPERGLNNTDMDILSQQTMESTVFEVGISAVSDADVPQQDVQNLVQAFQGAVSAAFRQNGLPNITVDSSNGTTQATIPITLPVIGAGTSAPSIEVNGMNIGTPTVRVIGVGQSPTLSSTPNVASNFSSNNSSTTSSANIATPVQAQSTTDESAIPSESIGSGDTSENAANNGQQTTSPQVLAEVVQQMRTVQTRLEPFIQQYYDILQNEPTFEENDSTALENSQRIFDRVSEALHYFSHAQHAISDLMLDLSLSTPRHLCCRPILVEQSAFVSSGFAVPSMIHLPRRADSNGNNNSNNNNNNNTVNNNTSQSANSSNETTASAEGSNLNRSSNENIQQSIRTATPFHVARLIQAVVDSVPANADVHVEINQNPTGFENTQIEVQRVPLQHSASATNTSSNNTTSSEPEGSQLRVTTATHPTTSTQTRSTARPQIHATGQIPVGQIRNLRPAMQLSSFDRYLPCNSHHIHEPEHHTLQQQQQVHQQAQQQQQQQQQRQQQQQPQTRGRINIQRTPQVHIQRSVPNSVRFATFLNNHLQNPIARPTSTPSSTSNTPTPSQPPVALASNNVLSSDNLNDAQLSTLIPLFGTSDLQLQIRDLVNVSPTPSTFNRIRIELREFIMSKLCLSPTSNEENVAMAVDHVITLLNQFLLLLPDLNIPEYDVRASIENLIRKTLPFIINLICDDESVEFGTRLLREIAVFSKRFIVILLHSIGRSSAQDYLKNIVEAIFTSITAVNANEEPSREALQWLRRHIHDEVLRRFQDIRLDSIDVIEFLVIRRPPPPTPSDQRNELMETDADEPENNDSMNSEANETIEDVEPLPTITIGSENWHSNFSAPWLPIITRDISLQRRQSPQRPFSDAYISGMSSKRRKLINSSKPAAAEPNNILPHSVRHVLSSRISHGASTAPSSSSSSVANTAVSIDEAVSSNQHIQEPYGSYEQALMNYVENRISNDSDFTPERYPNCSKWLSKNK